MQKVIGSRPVVTIKMCKTFMNIWPIGQSVKTLGFHPRETGSTPV